MKFKLEPLADKGLYLSGPNDQIPEGFMRRYRGVSALARSSIISRDGSAKLYDLNAHSLTYFASQVYSGVSTSFYRAAVEIKTGLSGEKLSFAIMAPVAGGLDHLFVAGGGELIKVDEDGNDSNWGIDIPSGSPTLADGGAGGSLDDGEVYKYLVTFKNSITGHRSNSNNVDASLAITADFVSLLHFDGTYLTTTITQSISGGPTFASNNATYCYLWNYYKFGSACLYIPSASNPGYIEAADNADFYLSADFSISFWYKFLNPVDKCLFGQYEDANNYMRFKYLFDYPTSEVNLLIKAAGSTIISLTADVASTAGWMHFEISRSGNNWYIFANGVEVASATNAGAYPNLTGTFRIGSGYDETTAGYLHGQGRYDEFAIVKGSALHTAGFEVPSSPFGLGSIDLDPGSTSVDITNIPQPSDDQVDLIELWRTQGGGTLFFKLVSLVDGTTTYTDNIADDNLYSEELPTTNHRPYSWFDDCYGPWNGSMFWITRTQEGERGRVYYSCIGRAEAMEGFIEVTSDSDGLQRIIGYAGNLFVISKSRAFQIYGTNPYFSREIAGVQGTIAPHTLQITPFGPIWESQDGFRIYSGGSRSPLVARDQIQPIMRGRTVENLESFSGTASCFARGEYIVTNGTYTIALDPESLKWRDLGIALGALFYSPSTDQILATFDSDVVDFEKEGTTQDVTTNIAFDIMTGTRTFDPPMIVEMIRIDANANAETVACYADINDAAVSQGNLTATAGRRYTEFDLDARIVDRLAVQLSGSIDAGIEIFGIEITGWPCVLNLFINGEPRQIPGRLAGDRQSLIFEAFSDEQESLQSVYVMDRLFYDFDTADVTMTVTLRIVNESGTESNIALGTIDTTTRTIGEINISKKGKFQRLTIAGNFNTASISLRRLELACKNRRVS
jgi:hypothetical protein